MDPNVLPRCLWSGETKFLQPPADLCTSLVVTRSIPAGTCFGPCLLHNTFYDTIAFIAQKSCDRRVKSYVFRVSGDHSVESVDSFLLELFVGYKSGHWRWILFDVSITI